jgi:hypothetical protein
MIEISFLCLWQLNLLSQVWDAIDAPVPDGWKILKKAHKMAFRLYRFALKQPAVACFEATTQNNEVSR